MCHKPMILMENLELQGGNRLQCILLVVSLFFSKRASILFRYLLLPQIIQCDPHLKFPD